MITLSTQAETQAEEEPLSKQFLDHCMDRDHFKALINEDWNKTQQALFCVCSVDLWTGGEESKNKKAFKKQYLEASESLRKTLFWFGYYRNVRLFSQVCIIQTGLAPGREAQLNKDKEKI